MSTQDTILSIDLAKDDCLYRILREDNSKRAVVYVLLEYLDLIPEHDRTYGPSALQKLSKLAGWYDKWKTLTISKDKSGLRMWPDAFEPHTLPREYVHDDLNYFDLFEMEEPVEVKTRTWRFRQQGKQCYLKMARFEFEVKALQREIKAYRNLTQHGSNLAPKLLGYAYEETQDRVVGLVMEEVVGRYPDITDLATCQEALRQLHGLGMTHGDVNRYNIFITKDGAKFVDFEESCIRRVLVEEDWADWALRADKEMQVLEEKLTDESGEGRPWEYTT